MREMQLPSGATLKIQLAPFAIAKALYQAVLRELKSVAISFTTEEVSVVKDLFCQGFASPEIEKALWACFTRCLYNGEKISEATFEPVDARQDYIPACMEVAKDNVGPFMKSLYAEYGRVSATLGNTRT